jgi:hypothetical protein
MKEKVSQSFYIWCMVAVAPGLFVAWIDSRPNWDDSGISAFIIFLIAIIFGFITSQKPWLIALAVSIWIPLFSIISTHNYGSLLALLPGFIGSYLGYFIRKAIQKS